jgi:catechol 2,3-dioxygenase-like lactoylglutathione lyase family enzyme
MIVGVHHAQITIPVGAEEAGREFYCGFLGLEEVAKPASLASRGGFWFRAGPFSVHVRPEDGVDRRASKAHLAYEVTNLAEWRRRLKGRGIRTDAGLPIPGHDRLEFRDPFGNRVELIQRLPG